MAEKSDFFGQDKWLRKKPFKRKHEERTFEKAKNKTSLRACPFCKSANLETRLLEWGGTPEKYNCKNCGRALPFTIELDVPKNKLSAKAGKTVGTGKGK